MVFWRERKEIDMDECRHVPVVMGNNEWVQCRDCGKVLDEYKRCEACGKLAKLHPETGYCKECMDT